MKTVFAVLAVGVLVVMLVLIGCDQATEPNATGYDAGDLDLFSMSIYPPTVTQAPSPLVTVPFGGHSETFWPFTGDDFSSTGKDPINLIFVGKCDPLLVRSALLSLNGVRPDFPPALPFTSTWRDGIGDEQTAYGSIGGWTGSAIQMECGEHNAIRLHLRLFRVGEWTLGNCHFEVLIPGTAEHEVLSYELAEQLVVYDFMRSGLLDPDAPMMVTDQINPSPFRAIRKEVYNELPVELRMLIGGPLDNQTEDIPIGTDGRAAVLNLKASIPWQPGTFTQEFDCVYGITMMKPFCTDGGDVVHVSGPVTLAQTTTVSGCGVLTRHFHAYGQLSVVPIDPNTGQPMGLPLSADILEHHEAWMKGQECRVSSGIRQTLLTASDEVDGVLVKQMRVNTRGSDEFRYYERCADDEPVVETRDLGSGVMSN